MSIRGDLEDWILEALKRHGGRASVTAIAKDVWDNHEKEIRAKGNALYTWQYDMRWSGQMLQKRGLLKKNRVSWTLI
jgi:hypothetical protein